MEKNVKRREGALSAAVEAYQKRREERMNAGTAGDGDAPDAEVAEEVLEAAAQEAAAAEIPATDEDTDAVQSVRDRRDRRDAEGDPEDVTGAMEVIAQQDEDIDTLLGVIDVLQSAQEAPAATDGDDTNTDEDEENSDGEDCAATDGEEKTDGEDAPAKQDRKDSANDFRELLRVVRVGDRLNMDGLESMSVKNAKKAVLRKLKPNLRMDGKSTAYVSAAFDMAVSELKSRKDTNFQRSQIMHKDSKPKPSVGSAADARQRMIDRRMKKEDK